MKNTKLLVCLLLFVSAFSEADWQTGTVSKLLIHDNGSGFEKIDVKLIGGVQNNMTWCDSIEEWSLEFENEAASAQYSMILAAFMAGKSIRIYSDGGAVCIGGNRNRIRNVEVNSSL